jgi:hypothetical protein
MPYLIPTPQEHPALSALVARLNMNQNIQTTKPPVV